VNVRVPSIPEIGAMPTPPDRHGEAASASWFSEAVSWGRAGKLRGSLERSWLLQGVARQFGLARALLHGLLEW